jgi:hypothetical protein
LVLETRFSVLNLSAELLNYVPTGVAAHWSTLLRLQSLTPPASSRQAAPLVDAAKFPAVFAAAHCAIHANHSWRTAKARRIESKALRFGIQ